MVLRKTGCYEIMFDLFVSYILMRTRGPLLLWLDFGKYWEYIFVIQVILYFGLDHRATVMLPDFR